jgi:threonylcarbamoyladenosine tRNA methylthiotransferase MtaB
MSGARPLRVGLVTVGCKLNQYETEGIAERFEDLGFAVVPFGARADVYVVNSCTVTTRSDYRSRQMLRRGARGNPDALIVATGCYAQRDPEALAAMSEVDLIVGNDAKPYLALLVRERLSHRATAGTGEDGTTGRPKVIVGRADGGKLEAFNITRFRGYTRAFLKIQDGCDNRCAYCAVPDARGPSRSRPLADVVIHARRLAASGYREIVLTGVHIGCYGADVSGPRLPELLVALQDVERLDRIRLGSVEPTELTPELADAILSLEKVCNHLHVPLESGSDRVLHGMRRCYSAADYEEAVRRVADRDALCGLGADVMVGFPGESEEDFAATVSLIERLPFTYLHVFAFSPRRDTPAASMEGQVHPRERNRRSRQLRALARDKSLAFRSGLIGTSPEVLIETGERRRRTGASGLTTNYVRVEARGSESAGNVLARIRVEGADEEATWGTMVPGSER